MWKTDSIDYELLRESLQVLLRNMGRGAQSEIYRVTGVNNVGRIALGEIKAPSIETWMALHNEYSHTIPAPTLKDWKPVISNVQNGNTFSGSGSHSMTGFDYGGGHKGETSKEALELAGLLDLTKSRLELRKMIGALKKEVEQILDAELPQKKMIEETA